MNTMTNKSAAEVSEDSPLDSKLYLPNTWNKSQPFATFHEVEGGASNRCLGKITLKKNYDLSWMNLPVEAPCLVDGELTFNTTEYLDEERFSNAFRMNIWHPYKRGHYLSLLYHFPKDNDPSGASRLRIANYMIFWDGEGNVTGVSDENDMRITARLKKVRDCNIEACIAIMLDHYLTVHDEEMWFVTVDQRPTEQAATAQTRRSRIQQKRRGE